MSYFQFHDEAGFPAEQRFLEWWLPRVAPEFVNLLGSRQSAERVHVVLSPSDLHARRFPPNPAELLSLSRPAHQDEEHSEPPDAGATSPTGFRPGLYLHGIATRARRQLALPAGIKIGEPVVCLDIPTISSLAATLEVPLEALLGRTAIHELSHVLRGHIDQGRGATHGYICEGDAQRDTWQLLADLLVQSDLAPTARAGRAAQVRLAPQQPGAYQQFGRSSSDRERWASAALDAPSQLVMRPSRKLLPLTRQRVIELPVSTVGARILGSPVVGDHIYLLGDELLVGPWVVVARTVTPYVAHRDDFDAMERQRIRSGNGHDSYEWLQMRPLPRLRAADPVASELSLPADAAMIAKSITGNDLRILEETLTLDAEPILQARAARMREEDRRWLADLAQELGSAGAAKLEALAGYDPFMDGEC